MSSSQIRQAEIFAGEDWTVLYRAFTQINFNAYDPPSINAALREYIQTNYPEDFNDWIESSEFVAIIDLLSWLAGSLAFRTDVNARENFLETAQARESVLRLARFLSYNPRRAQAARGLVKVTEIKTTESVQDSFGVNLNNRAIKWDDPDNPDWMEQFTIVLNAAMPTTNPFGIPFKQGSISGATTQLYRLNNQVNPQCVYKFKAVVDGNNEQFEIVNLDFEEGVGFNEQMPNPTTAFHLIFRNDGKGNASARTGFFLMFKQGSLNQELFTIENPVENRLLDIDTDNISETDVWAQSISDYGDVESQWTKVPAVFGENITFTDIAPDVRDIFSVITRDSDRISLRFGDGRFGNVPVGNLKVWYRTVNGEQYAVRPRDMENVHIDIPYVDITGRNQTLSMRFSLQETVSNAIGSEDIEQIRRRAPRVFGTQNRMVSGEDYNVFPLSSNEIVKLRAVNRVYSGHSRYLDINDPTATFQDTVVLADDGILYKEPTTQYLQVPQSSNLSPAQIINDKIQGMLGSISLRDYVLGHFISNASALKMVFDQSWYKWTATSSSGFSTVGSINISTNITLIKPYLLTGSKAKFQWIEDNKTVTRWVHVTRVAAQSQDNLVVVTVDDVVPSDASLVQIVPAFRSTLNHQVVKERLDDGFEPRFATLTGVPTSETKQIEYFISNKLPFTLYYRFTQNSTLVFGGNVLSGQWIAQSPSEPHPQDAASNILAFKVLNGNFLGGQFWSLETLIGSQYVFESVNEMRWGSMRDHKVIDGTSGTDKRDTITVLWRPPYQTEMTAFQPVTFDVIDNVYDPDGYPDFRKVVVTPSDSDDDGSPDDPTAFRTVVAGSRWTMYEIDATSTFKTRNAVEMKYADTTQAAAALGGWNANDVYFTTTDKTFRKYENQDWVHVAVESPSGSGIWVSEAAGYVAISNSENHIKFQWKHYAGTDIRIDPAPTNIIDVFVLTAEYDFLVRQWIKEGAIAADMPEPPNDLDLDVAFSDFEQYKMFSDELIWRPVKYKYLFGSSAQQELQAQFKIVRLPNSTLSDGEIRSRVVQAINDYFDVNKWEFGETFYFSELSAYLHMQLATAVASVVIVPLRDNGVFGELYEVRCATDEVFISTAQVSDVVIIDSNTMANLRIK